MRKPHQSTAIRCIGLAMIVLTAALGLVYALPSIVQPLKAEKRVNQKAELQIQPIEILRDFKTLPPEVDRMRRAILAAAMGGDIETMRIPIEMNEIPPLFAQEKITNPIAYWKKGSGDGEGREILAILVQLFRTGFLRKAQGTDDELYIWPYFAEMPLDALTPAQEVELLTLVSAERAKSMKTKGRYDHYTIGIANDGTWHYFINKHD